MWYYKGEFSLKTYQNDTLENLNKILKLQKARQSIIKRKYKRQFKFALIHFNEQGQFIETVFDLGDTIHIKPLNSIIRDR